MSIESVVLNMLGGFLLVISRLFVVMKPWIFEDYGHKFNYEPYKRITSYEFTLIKVMLIT